MRDNFEWILEKTKYEYTEDEIVTLMNLLIATQKIITKKKSGGNLKEKFDRLLKIFLKD
jgi:hypothetical protein